MGWQGIATLSVVAMCFGMLVFTQLAADLVLIAGAFVLLMLGILTPATALAGLANEGMVTVAVLFVVGAGVRETGGIDWLAQRLFGRPKSVRGAVARLMFPTAALSAVLNNTPLVAMLIPAVSDWSKKNRIPASKLMIPLSYAAILGGVITLIGTSTNLVVHGQLQKERTAEFAKVLTRQIESRAWPKSDEKVRAELDEMVHKPNLFLAHTERAADALGMPDEQTRKLRELAEQSKGIGMFDITWVGLPVAVIGCLFVLVTAPWLLPDRQSVLSQLDDPREYTVEMLVPPDSPLAGRTIEEAGLRHLPGLYLAEIDRQGHVLPAVSPDERLEAGDRLLLVGIVDSVKELQRIRGLVPATDQVFKLTAPRSTRCLNEAVVSNTCPLVGQSIRDGRFRSHYNAVVLAVARDGERIQQKIGDIVLRTGDTLLLESHPSFVEEHRNRRDFLLVSQLEDSHPPRHDRAVLALMLLLALVVCVSFQWVSMFKAGLVVAALMLIFRCTSVAAARRSVELPTLLAIAAALALGDALDTTGVAQWFAHGLISLAQGDRLWTLAAIYFVTMCVTELITNNAAAALMFPFAMKTAQDLEVSYMPFVLAVMLAASASFATPIGYQTNLMVYGPGGYRFSDFARLGVPLNLFLAVVSVLLLPLFWPF